MGFEARRIGDHLLGRRIAVGGMAEIFEARRVDAPADAPFVVLKILLPQYARDPEVVRMLEHEAELQERLKHPGLVRVLEHGHTDGQAYLVMEHVDGVALSDLMPQRDGQGATLPRHLALHVVRAIGTVLAYVHEARDDAGALLDIVHRDVTPQNVLISRRGEVRLGDFGIARSSLRDARTRTGVIKGKLRYVAPEQVTGSAIDGRTDLYGLGVVAFELLTGQPYLSGESEIELLREAESPTPRSLADYLEEVDPKLDRLVQRVLSRFPEERPHTVNAFLRELESLCGEADDTALARDLGERVEAIAPASFPLESRAVAVTAAPSRLPWVIAVGVLAAAAAVWAGAGLVSEEPTDRDLERDVSAVDASAAAAPDAAGQGAGGAGLGDEDGSVDVVALVDDGLDPTPAIDVDDPGRARLRPPDPRPPTQVEDPPVEASTGDAARRSALASRLAEIRTDLRRRGVRNADLDPSLRARLTAGERAIEEGSLDAAAAELAAAGPAAEGTVVDGDFVRRKVQRVDAAIRRAEQAGADTARAQQLSGSALSDFMAGRHEAANRRLNEILDALPTGR